ncbi:hypothetical protein Lalb_Chr04g0262011 [Lupinus albus]|uniref:Knottin, scorpion toxin n=1 Tax=Lupinus albus TaxID=3870 RepID=A0A6A4QRA1_LUPAL|nr:hypothetical protein Lalb_Chr04g0262011 [Lupinus albus]
MNFLKIAFAVMIVVLLFSHGMAEKCFYEYGCTFYNPSCDAYCKNIGFRSGKCVPPDPDVNFCCCY